MIKKIHPFNKMNFISNINEVIRAVLNPLLSFHEKISHEPKALKAPKELTPLKALKCIKSPKQKHKNANKRISDYFPLRCF